MKKKDPFREKRSAMVNDQIIRRGIIDARVVKAFKDIPRHVFVADEHKEDAYTDRPLPIGNGQTISQPYIVALMSSLLNLEGDEKVLEIGTGSGYQTAILAELAKTVYSVEFIRELSERAAKRFDMLEIENVYLRVGDGSVGWKANQPYDRVIITAAAPKLSDQIKEQVKIGGKIVAPIGERWNQTLEVWRRDDSGFFKEKILPVVFVPLKGRFGWQD